MANQITNYQCPSCTGPLKFSTDSATVACPYCDSSFEVATIEQIFAERERAATEAANDAAWDLSQAGGEWSRAEAEHIRAYTCPSCAAELLCDDTTAATSCPYCGNPTIVPSQLSGALKPDYVIPFKLDKAAATAALQKHYKGKKFLPSSFSQMSRIEEIKGIYVPFWLFDAESDAKAQYHATMVHSHVQGNQKVIVTEHYRVVREGGISFEKIPVDGSVKMPDAHMEAIEPYDYTELTPFSTAYLPGYLADKYNVDADECSRRANTRIRESTRDALAATTVGYSSLTPQLESMRLKQKAVKYALLPVWMLYTKWEGKDFLFAMNGQTGKLIGNLPVDRRKYAAWLAGIALPLMLLLGLILF